MFKVGRYILLSLIASTSIIFAGSNSTQAVCIASKDFNGVWQANDGGTYYVRQIGNDIWWVGMSGDSGKTWTNVFKGVRNGNTVKGQWADVPMGRINSGGILNLSVQGNGSVSGFTRSQVTGGFGGSSWYQPCNDNPGNPVRE